MNRPRAFQVQALYALSGLLTLGYQVAWFRIWTDRFGSTNLTFALVLCAFLGGLAAGAMASARLERFAARVVGSGDRLRIYGVLELAVTATVLSTLLARLVPPDGWGLFDYVVRNGIHERSVRQELWQVALVVVSVFVPCFFMGATFPLLCAAFARDGRFPAALYAWNTLGACSGVLVSEFVLLPRLGHATMLVWLAAANALLGLRFLLAAPMPSSQPAAVVAARPTAVVRWLYLAAASGLFAGLLEGDALRRAILLYGPSPSVLSFVSFWAVLGIFIASAAVHAWRGLRLVHVRVAWVVALVAYWVVWRSGYALEGLMKSAAAEHAMADIAGARPVFVELGLGPLLVLVGVLVLPAFTLVSLLLPWVCNRLQEEGHHLGTVYGVNTVAFCAGLLGATWLAPRVNVFYALNLAFVLFAIVTAFLFLLRDDARPRLWQPLSAVAAAALACVLTPSGFDRGVLHPRDWTVDHPVRALRSDGAHTTYVVTIDGADILCFDNHRMSSNHPAAQTYMRLMAHFPLLAQERPESALLICFGVGNTAAAIAAHDSIRRIDIVDLSSAVIETAPEFARSSENVHLDPRVRFFHDDGRSFLAVEGGVYDLITSEPPPPMHEGVHRLYSREYYTDAARHLSRDGLMSQWLPIQQMPRRAVELAVSTFLDVFPHALLFIGHGSELILVGGRGAIDLESLARNAGARTRVRDDLARLGIRSPHALLCRILALDRRLRSDYGGRGVVSDQRNDLAHRFVDPRDPAIVPHRPRELLAGLPASLTGELAPLLTSQGRLRFHVPDFPADSLMADPDRSVPPLDWFAIDRAALECDRLLEQGRLDDAVQVLPGVVDRWPELPRQLLRIASLRIESGAPAAAQAAIDRVLALEPDSAEGLFVAGVAHTRLGDVATAVARFDRALQLRRSLLPSIHAVAWELATCPDPGQRRPAAAVAIANLLVDRTGHRDPRALDALASAQAAAGEFDAAVRSAELASTLAESTGATDFARSIGRRARLFRAGEAFVEQAALPPR